jgi:4-hydroxy-tetrahydrodipicolinate synthase
MARGDLFAGVTVAIITPFKNGEVDYDALGKLIDWHVEQGTDCLAPCGTTGESPRVGSRSWRAPVRTAPPKRSA